MQQQQNIQPAYEVETLEGTEKVLRSYFDEGVLKQEEVEVPRGWNVFFPAGHSIRIRDEAEMRRLGLNNAPGLMDMSGDDDTLIKQTSLKQQSQRKSRKSRKSAATNGVMKDG